MNLIDEIVIDWKKERQDINCAAKPTVCRLLMVYSRYMIMLEKRLNVLGIAPNVFSVLVTIRRKGEQAEVSVKKIMQEVLVTSGGMSNLITRLIKNGLISKRPDNNDARSMLIKLTPKGLDIIDKAMKIQADCENNLLSNLDVAEKEQLTELLQKVLIEEH